MAQPTRHAQTIAAAVQVNSDAFAGPAEADRDQFIALIRRIIAGMQVPALNAKEDHR